MIRSHENPIAIRAGALSVLVHVLLLVILLISFNWKTVQPLSIAEVELWDSLPSPMPQVKPLPEPPKPEPVVEPEPPKPEPVIKEEPKPEPPPEPKPDIVVKKKAVVEPKKIEEPKKVEKPKPDPKIKEAERKKLEEEKLKKLQQELLAEDQQQPQHEQTPQASSNNAKAAASAGEINEYKNKIANRIKGFVNPALCGTDKVELRFKIAVMPTGELAGNPKLLKTSGIPACDDAVERAILQAGQGGGLPLPADPALRALFRDIELPFYPNER